MSNIGFIGCHEISGHCLQKICQLAQKSGDNVTIVFNLDENEAKKHSAYVDFNSLKNEFGFKLHYVDDVATNENITKLRNANLDILFIIGWHRIVPLSVLDTAKIRLGIHSSLLPKDRGPSPINWQIIRGQNLGGVTLFHLTTGVDSGDILDMKKYEISMQDTVKDVYDKATINSLLMLESNWNDIHNLSPKAIPQNENEATYNERRKPGDGLINWNVDSVTCYNWIRALTKPYPGAFTYWTNKKIFLWSSQLSTEKAKTPGEILECDEKIIVSTNNGCLELLELQIENEPVYSSQVFINSYNLKKTDLFTNCIT